MHIAVSYFLPSSIAYALGVDLPESASATSQESLNLAGSHSLSDDTIRQCELPIESGIIGWVAKHGRSIHVSPFEHDSRTLGTYHTDQQLKSFIGVPISFSENPSSAALSSGYLSKAIGTTNSVSVCGVIACDSKKAFAFSKLQGKLLEELAASVGAFVRLAVAGKENIESELSWEGFCIAGNNLVKAVGASSLSIIRITPTNVRDVELALGIRKTIELGNQVQRLIEQALPPKTPICRLPSGELLIALDNMMTSFYQSKIDVVAGHAAEQGQRFNLEFSTLSRGNRNTADSFEALLNEPVASKPFSMTSSTTTNASVMPASVEKRYEHRRA